MALKKFKVTAEQGEESEYSAIHHEHAAKLFAEDYDVDDHPLLSGATYECTVTDHDGAVKRFRLSGEALPQY